MNDTEIPGSGPGDNNTPLVGGAVPITGSPTGSDASSGAPPEVPPPPSWVRADGVVLSPEEINAVLDMASQGVNVLEGQTIEGPGAEGLINRVQSRIQSFGFRSASRVPSFGTARSSTSSALRSLSTSLAIEEGMEGPIIMGSDVEHDSGEAAGLGNARDAAVDEATSARAHMTGMTMDILRAQAAGTNRDALIRTEDSREVSAAAALDFFLEKPVDSATLEHLPNFLIQAALTFKPSTVIKAAADAGIDVGVLLAVGIALNCLGYSREAIASDANHDAGYILIPVEGAEKSKATADEVRAGRNIYEKAMIATRHFRLSTLTLASIVTHGDREYFRLSLASFAREYGLEKRMETGDNPNVLTLGRVARAASALTYAYLSRNPNTPVTPIRAAYQPDDINLPTTAFFLTAAHSIQTEDEIRALLYASANHDLMNGVSKDYPGALEGNYRVLKARNSSSTTALRAVDAIIKEIQAHFVGNGHPAPQPIRRLKGKEVLAIEGGEGSSTEIEVANS